jgi:acetyltransferase-like isoleucine patch superfamily enzyme
MNAIRNLITMLLSVFYKFKLFQKCVLKLGRNSILFCRFSVKGNNNQLITGYSCTIRSANIEIIGQHNKIIFGDRVKVYEGIKILIEGDNCEVRINNKTTIGSLKIQLGEKNTKVIIGEDCMVSRDITINTSDFHSIIDLKNNTRINQAKNVLIGNHVWIGNGVYVNKGAQIGNNIVIGARSVVTSKSFEDNSLIGGIPAKLIRNDITWDRKILD